MDFLGDGEGNAAPRLRDAYDVEDWNQVYEQCLLIIRRMYQRCRLVHADLSEYNLLYHQGEVWVIDVSQAVENDHPMALEFLRRDCGIINDFFKKKLDRVLTTQATFDFVTDISIKEEEEESYLDNSLEELMKKTAEQIDHDTHKDNIFKEIYIPRTLQELDFDEIDKIRKDGAEGLFDKLTGLKSSMKAQQAMLKAKQESEEKDTLP